MSIESAADRPSCPGPARPGYTRSFMQSGRDQRPRAVYCSTVAAGNRVCWKTQSSDEADVGRRAIRRRAVYRINPAIYTGPHPRTVRRVLWCSACWVVGRSASVWILRCRLLSAPVDRCCCHVAAAMASFDPRVSKQDIAKLSVGRQSLKRDQMGMHVRRARFACRVFVAE